MKKKIILLLCLLFLTAGCGPSESNDIEDNEKTIENQRKSILGTEGIAALKAAETAFQSEQMKGNNAKFKSTDDVCFTLNYLFTQGFFDKGNKSSNDGYYGSVLADYENGRVSYTFWITNSKYAFFNANSSNFSNIDDSSVVRDYSASDNNILNTCGGANAILID